MHSFQPEITTKGDNAISGSGDQRIIVIGASSGGLEALRTLMKGLSAGINATLFVVWHMSPDMQGILPQVLNKAGSLPVKNAGDGQKFAAGHVYVAPPDHHLLVEAGMLRVTHGPKENRFRPAIDPLFRSAAREYGSRVIGVILSGSLDDGTAGLWQVKHHGGIAIVQDPLDAEVPSMPASALRQVEVDHCLPVAGMAGLLNRLCETPVPPHADNMKDEKTKLEIDIAADRGSLAKGSLNLGELSPFACPECHGVLSRIMDGSYARFRCHTGHAYSPDTLMAALTGKIEDSLYNAIRGIDESILLLNHMGDHFAETNQLQLAALYFKKTREASDRAELVRKAARENAPLSQTNLLKESEVPAEATE